MKIVFLLLILVLLVFAILVFIPRVLQEYRARRLLARCPDAERESVLLSFQHWSPGLRRKEMNEKILNMAKDGWIFLKASEVNPLRSLFRPVVRLHFVRKAGVSKVTKRCADAE